MDSVLTKQQYKSFGPRPIEGYAKGAALWAHVRFDDECGNGHNTFAITGSVREPGKRDIAAGGCLHEDIARIFPELAHLIKWHLCSTDGPMHYPANPIYLAGERDHWGLLKGERLQIVNGRSKLPAWHLVAIDADGTEMELRQIDQSLDAATEPHCPYTLAYRPWCRVGEGKARELDLARSCAVWPDATDEDLTAPDLKERLLARLPALMKAFREDIEAFGFTW